MTQKNFLLTFDWVVNYLIEFNNCKIKNRNIMYDLKYIFKLAQIRGYSSKLVFFDQLCQTKCLESEIIKHIQKLSEFVSVEEMKTLLISKDKNFKI